MREKERTEKETIENERRYQETIKKTNYDIKKHTFKEKMKNYRIEEEMKIREKMGDSLITVDKIKKIVRQKKMDTKIEEEE